MMRWLIVFALIAITGFSLLGLGTYRAEAVDSGDVDEILAYEITPQKPVMISLPAKIDRVFVTTWALVPASKTFELATPYLYAFDVAVQDAEGTMLRGARYNQQTRISVDPRAPALGNHFVARVASGSEWVTDPRTTEVDTSAIMSKGGRLSIRSATGQYSRVLVRIAYSQARGNMEREVLLRTLNLSRRHRIADDRASLGFLDMPASAQAQALAAWGRRIGALGHKDVDYTERRLLLGNFRAPINFVRTRQLETEISRDKLAAINVSRPFTLRVHSSSDTLLEMRDGATTLAPIPIQEQAFVDIPITGGATRTLIVGAKDALNVRFSASVDDASAQVGDLVHELREDGRVEILPDRRKQRYYRLHPTDPIKLEVAARQEVIGITVRGLDFAANERKLTGNLSVRWANASARGEARSEVTVTRSKFDAFFPGQTASDPSLLMLHLPRGAESLEIMGDLRFAVSLWTREPDVSESRLNVAYAAPLEPEMVWRHAPFDLRTWATLVPSNVEQLWTTARALELVAQVRIEKLGARSGEAPEDEQRPVLPERSIVPDGAPLRRELLTAAWLGRGLPIPDGMWSKLDAERRLRIEERGPSAGRLSLFYRAGTLGGLLRVLADGNEIARQPLVLESGTLDVALAPGEHDIRLEGLEGGEAYARAAPATGGPTVKRQSVFELSARAPLDFSIAQKSGETLNLVLFVITEQQNAPFALSYSIDGSKPKREEGRFFRRATEVSGTLVGKAGEAGWGLLWEAARQEQSAAFPDGIGRVDVRLGDDLSAGRHRVRIRLTDPGQAQASRLAGSKGMEAKPLERVFVRAVVVGQAAQRVDSDFRLWTSEPL